MNTITRYRVTTSPKDSTNWEFYWFDSKEEADQCVKELKAKGHNHARVTPWEFDTHKERKVVDTVKIPRFYTFEIKECEGTYTVEIDNAVAIDGTFNSIEEARDAIDTYMKAPVKFFG